jgi:hypothetical protein
MESIESVVAAQLHRDVKVGTWNCLEEPLDGAVPVGSNRHRTAVFVLYARGTAAWATFSC